MKWSCGENYHPFAYRFFEGGTFPATITYEDLTATLNTSFRVWLKFEQLLQSKTLTDKERILFAFNLCVEKVDDNFPIDILNRGILWFHSADIMDRSWLFDHPKRKKHKILYDKMKEEAANKKPGLSLFWDTGAIWSSFMSAFGIDLFKLDLHWWAFLALINELPDGCALNRLIRQRTKDIKEIKDQKDQGEFLVRQYLASIPSGGVLEGDVQKISGPIK